MQWIGVDWVTIKDFATARALSMQWVETSEQYHLKAFDGVFSLSCVLTKGLNDEIAEFESSWKDGGNHTLNPVDSDNMIIARNKVTKTGWTFNRANIKFETSSKDSLRFKSVDLVDLPGATLKFFNASGTDITAEAQGVLDSDCVLTQVDFEPPYDNEIIAGSLVLFDEPVNDMWLWVIGVPDIPAAYGGSKEFVTEEALHMLGPKQILEADGRASKPLSYSATYHTNKIRAIIRHAAGEKVRMQMTYQQFKA